MDLQRVSLHKIKNFDKSYHFDFSQSKAINTISGVNGSGKTTLFKSIILAQKLFFLYDGEPFSDLADQANSFFNGIGSYIELEFKFNNNSISSFKLLCQEKSESQTTVYLHCQPDSMVEIKKNWNPQDPKNLIIYIDSNRNAIETDFSNQNLNLFHSTDQNLIIEYITKPEELFLTTYERIIQDYLRERLIPSKPRTDLPHVVAKILFSTIMDYISISNFSGLAKREQFILQVRQDIRGAKNYDARQLSSGEKTLFYILHFISYVNSISMLIIDEPENNLHEEMLSKFIKLLSAICNESNFSALVKKLNKTANNKDITDILSAQMENFYMNHNLSKVFLLTHSKNLIYNNFSIGENYIIENGLIRIDFEDHEKKLREIGISKIYSKILFTEGDTEQTLLETILSQDNIKIKNLGGSKNVVDTFKKFNTFRGETYGISCSFLIDKDTKSESEIAQIRAESPVFFDSNFFILDRHEIENYLLEPNFFQKLFLNHNSINGSIDIPSLQEITDEIKKKADQSKMMVFNKKLSSLNNFTINNIKQHFSNKSIGKNGQSNYESDITNIISNQFPVMESALIQNFSIASTHINNWEIEWQKLCDGKATFRLACVWAAHKLNIKTNRAEEEIIQIALNSNNSGFSKVISKIKNSLQ